MELDFPRPKRRLSLEGTSSHQLASREITMQKCADEVARTIKPSDAHQRFMAELVQLALEDPTYKVKIKYIPLPEKKPDEDEDKGDEDLSKNKKVPMAL